MKIKENVCGETGTNLPSTAASHGRLLPPPISVFLRLLQCKKNILRLLRYIHSAHVGAVTHWRNCKKVPLGTYEQDSVKKLESGV
jgi:hypothetical protein